MSSFRAIVRVTVQQLTGRKRFIGFTLLSLLPAALLLLASRARDGAGIDTDLGGLLVSPFFSLVLPLMALILAGSALGDERRDKTLSFLMLRPVARLQIVLAKTVGACGVASSFAAFGSIALAITYVLVGGNLNVLPAIIAGSVLVSVLYGSIFVLLGNLVKRPTLAGVLYVIFIEQALVGEMPRLAPLSPWRVGFAATLDLMPRGFPARAQLGAIGELAPSAPAALIVTLITAALMVSICTALLKKTDSV